MNILERFNAMDYGPAPEARNEADAWLAARDFSKALYIGGEWKAAASGKTFDVSEPSTTKLLAKVSDAGAADIDAAVSAAAKALPKWSGQSGYQRSKVLYAIGRAMQRHQRLFAVLESIDNGKPIRESRDIDVPLAIRHFIHHAGWAQALDREFPDHRPAGVVGPGDPVEFPAADARLENRAGTRRRLHGGAEAGGVHAADGDSVRADLRERRRTEGRRQYRAGRPRGGRGTGRASRRPEDRLHRLVGGRKDHPQGHRRFGQEALAGTRRQVGFHRLRGCRSR